MGTPTLSDRMDFDHVIRVHPDGTVTDAPEVWAPYVYDDETGTTIDALDKRWELMHGYTGQYGYNGPVMHPSEFIGGGLAGDILATPGLYASVVVFDTSADADEDDNIMGWAVARILDEE